MRKVDETAAEVVNVSTNSWRGRNKGDSAGIKHRGFIFGKPKSLSNCQFVSCIFPVGVWHISSSGPLCSIVSPSPRCWKQCTPSSHFCYSSFSPLFMALHLLSIPKACLSPACPLSRSRWRSKLAVAFPREISPQALATTHMTVWSSPCIWRTWNRTTSIKCGGRCPRALSPTRKPQS